LYYAVIMAGGSGTRLWPLSRQAHPKQSLTLVGSRTMFQHAVDRLDPLFPSDRIFVVTRAEHAAQLRAQAPELPAENFILEPEGRGTAPAIGLAAIHLYRRDPCATMAVLTADHFITDTVAFRRVLKTAACAAGNGYLVTLGIKPDAPSTGYGYIEQGAAVMDAGSPDVFRVERFIEKPAANLAADMFKAARFVWNSGMFVWSLDRILAEFLVQMPDFRGQLAELEELVGTSGYATALARLWPRVRKQTIDYGVMEKASGVVVIPAAFGWTDVGSWGSLRGLLPSDDAGNILIGHQVTLDTHRTLALGDKRLIATLGVSDLVIVDTDDALLICARGREEEVRQLVDRLKADGHDRWL
jgi:mannose-1-phosphate guanylyltransferase